MSGDILAYRLLKSATIQMKTNKQLIKVTLPELQYDSMKDQLKKTFSDSSRHIPIKEKGFVKTRNALRVAGFDNLKLTDFYEDYAPNTTEYYLFREQQPNGLYRENNDDVQSYSRKHDTFYNRNNYHPIINQANTYRISQQPALRFQPHRQYAPKPNR